MGTVNQAMDEFMAGLNVLGAKCEGRKSRAPRTRDLAITSLATFRWIVAVGTSTSEGSARARVSSGCRITSLVEWRRREEPQ